MSKEIFLYSADNKYQAYVELADNTDRFGCPDHSFFKLIENRNDDKLYLIAEARDGLLETEKDQRIAELKQDLEFTTKTANELIEIKHKLEQQLVEKDKEIKRLKTKQELTFIHSKEDYFQRCNLLEEANIKLQFTQTQLAIHELEKVKELLLYEYKKYPIVYDKTDDIVAGALDRDKVNEIIDQQIKELKGEHNE